MTPLYILLGIVAVVAIVAAIFLNTPKFGGTPSGKRLERMEKSPNYRNGAFHNREVTPMMTSNKNFFQSMWEFLFSKDENLKPNHPLDMEKSNLKSIPRTKDYIVWFGHSSYLIQVNGKRFLVDPVFGPASPVKFMIKPFKGTTKYDVDDLPDIDYLVITHDHWDHLEYETVAALEPRVRRVVCPLGVGAHFEKWGYPSSKLLELDWDEVSNPKPDVKINCLTARHFSGRGLKRNGTLWASYLIETPGFNFFVGGDSGYGKHFKEIGEKFAGQIDLAMLENGQYDQGWKYIHTLPKYQANVMKDLNARNNITVHHSKYALAHHPWDEPLKTELKIRNEGEAPVTVLKLGRPTPIVK